MKEHNMTWDYPLKDIQHSIRKYFHIYYFNVQKWLNRQLLKTYPLIEECSRCEDCGRNVHDFIVPDEIWIEAYGSEHGILCYDCFCNRLDKKRHFKWRIHLRNGD